MATSLPTPSYGLFQLKLPFALAVSAVLHAAVLFWPTPAGTPPTPAAPPLVARLKPVRPAAPPAPPPAEPLLKDTLSTQDKPDAAPPAPAAVRPARLSPVAAARARERAQRKLNAHLFYPQDAIDRDLEGTVTLRLLLDDAGRVLEAGVLASSGHPVLDRAAMEAARRMGRVDAGGLRELMLPITFRLE